VCDEASGEACPIFPGITTRLHWSIPDPSAVMGTEEEKLDQVRRIRDTIKLSIEQWIDQFRAEKKDMNLKAGLELHELQQTGIPPEPVRPAKSMDRGWCLGFIVKTSLASPPANISLNQQDEISRVFLSKRPCIRIVILRRSRRSHVLNYCNY